MTRFSPALLQRLRHHYEPWTLLHHSLLGHSTKDRSGRDAELLAEINAHEKEFARQSDATLQDLSGRLRKMAKSGKPLDEYLPVAFALAREASRRALGLFHYDVQILGGLAISRGTIAEMATGEGKTLVQSLAAFTLSLVGRGVHVATANSYLAERDFAFAEPLYQYLGVSAALLPERVPPPQKRAAYEADITYGTGTEFGFDYLRDQVTLMEQASEKLGESFREEILGRTTRRGSGCQRELAFAIIDEIDSVLIDEASTPLVISGAATGENPAPEVYLLACEVASLLLDESEKVIDPVSGTATLTVAGKERIHSGEFVIDWAGLVRPWERYVENALRAAYLLDRDTDYLVNEKEKIVLVDSFTGRVREGSSWKEGLHQAVEAFEKVPISPETTSVAGISRQRFYTLYDHVSGMTGTASEAAGELWRFYRLPVTPIPRNRPSLSTAHPTRIFTKERQKFEALARDLKNRQATGQPVLVGCRTISESETVSEVLTAHGVPHALLNAKTSEDEADLIAKAGERGAVTVATNMAGRGTHISLGDGVIEAGGLHVVATGFEMSGRIDRQLTGRSARQGQPGSHQFFLSAEDDILVEHSPDTVKKMKRARASEDGELRADRWAGCFETAQRNAEKEKYRSRVATFQHDQSMSEMKNRLG